MSYQPLPLATPEQVGLRSGALLEMFQAMENCGTELHGVMVARHGRVAAQGWWRPFTRDTVHINHSFGKTYVATAVGAAVMQGLMTVEDRIADIFAKELAEYGVADAGNMAKLRVKHLLTMTGGMAEHPKDGADIVRHYLTTPIVHEPGTVFMYNTTGSSMLGEIVRRVSGRSVLDFMKEAVFAPAGFDMARLRWMCYGNGLHAAPGTAANTENNLRLGLLYLNGGAWNGKQLLPRDYVEQATRCHIGQGSAGYGYQMWMNSVPRSFRFVGGHGQNCLMSKDHDIAVAIHQAGSEPHDTEAVDDIVNRCLFSSPLPERLPEDPTAFARLQAYLGSREIPQPGAQPVHGFDKDWEGMYHTVEGSFHLQPELLPFGEENVNRGFYAYGDPAVKTLEIRRCAEGFTLLVNGRDQLLVRLDGRWTPHPARCAMPNYDQSCAAAVVEENRMVIQQWYFQTCFKTRLLLEREGDTLRVKARKERLHDDRPYIWREAVLRKD